MNIQHTFMSEPKLNVSLKSNQPAYPLLHLFFHLALQLELLRLSHLMMIIFMLSIWTGKSLVNIVITLQWIPMALL